MWPKGASRHYFKAKQGSNRVSEREMTIKEIEMPFKDPLVHYFMGIDRVDRLKEREKA